MLYLKDNKTGLKPTYETSLEVRKEEESISFRFVAKHCSFYSAYDAYNSPIYEGDVVEVFLSRGKKDEYLEIEVAPNGALFFASIHNDGKSPNAITYLPEEGISYKYGKEGDELRVEIVLDRKKLELGDELEYNAFRIETDGGHKERHLFALSPTMCGSFHVRKAFIEL